MSNPYIDSTMVLSDNGTVRACFTDIGEGLVNEDYDLTDPEDRAVYRLDVNVSPALAGKVFIEDDLEDADGQVWHYPEDGSICTTVTVEDLTATDGEGLLRYAANMIANALATGENSVKGCMDRLSYLPRRNITF